MDDSDNQASQEQLEQLQDPYAQALENPIQTDETDAAPKSKKNKRKLKKMQQNQGNIFNPTQSAAHWNKPDPALIETIEDNIANTIVHPGEHRAKKSEVPEPTPQLPGSKSVLNIVKDKTIDLDEQEQVPPLEASQKLIHEQSPDSEIEQHQEEPQFIDNTPIAEPQVDLEMPLKEPIDNEAPLIDLESSLKAPVVLIEDDTPPNQDYQVSGRSNRSNQQNQAIVSSTPGSYCQAEPETYPESQPMEVLNEVHHEAQAIEMTPQVYQAESEAAQVIEMTPQVYQAKPETHYDTTPQIVEEQRVASRFDDDDPEVNALRKGMGLMDDDRPKAQKKKKKGSRKNRHPVAVAESQLDLDNGDEVRDEPKPDPLVIAEQIRLEQEAKQRQLEADEQMAKDLEAAFKASSDEYDSESESEEQSDESFEDDLPLPGMIQNRNIGTNYNYDFESDMPGARIPFNRDQFKLLIQRTYEDYYPGMYDLESFEIDEYMKLVQDEQLEARFGVYLENSPDNILTLKSMPWLDIGDLPSSYQKFKTECFQVYKQPRNMMPEKGNHHLYFRFVTWRRSFEKRTSMIDIQQSTILSQNNLQIADIEDTLERATLLLQPYRGWVANFEIIKNIIIAITSSIVFLVAVLIGLGNNNPLPTAIIVVIWVGLVLSAVYFLKYLYSKRYRQSNFLLSVFCRAENNRHYLKLGLELRPGFLGKWIEISQINLQDTNFDIPAFARDRFLAPANELRSKQQEISMLKNQDLLRQQKKIEAQIIKSRQKKDQEQQEAEQEEVAHAAFVSDPNELSQPDLNRPSNISMNSHTDIMLSSAVKLASESSFSQDKSNNNLVPKKKKKKAKKKAHKNPNHDEHDQQSIEEGAQVSSQAM